MKHALALALVLSGCIDTEATDDGADGGDLATASQALNGDTWTTVENNGFANGLGATYNAVAVSQTTGRAFVAGARIETSGATRWLVRASDTTGNNFTQNDLFSLGGSSRATAAVSDPAGNVLVAGEAIDNAGVPHWVIRRTTDGVNWNTALDRAYPGQSHALPTGMSIDGWDDVGIYITGSVTSPTGAVSELTQHAPNGSAAFVDFSTVAGRAPTAVCPAWNGNALTATLTGTSHPWLVATTTLGNSTWDNTTPPIYGFTPLACSFSTNGNTLIGGFDDSNHWEMAQIKLDGTPIPGGIDPILGDPGTAVHAQFLTVGRGMAAGAIATFGGGVPKWRTRLTTDNSLVTWVDSDRFGLTPDQPSVAKAITHSGDILEGSNGTAIYVAGEAIDASGRKHGIVRRMAIGQ